MEKNNAVISKELEEIAPIFHQLKPKNVFQVPFSYFSDLPSSILDKIISGAEESRYFTRKIPYLIPDNYFETLPSTVLAKIEKQETKSGVFQEMEEISPLLNTITKNHVYTIPNGYLRKADWYKREAGVKKVSVFSIRRGKNVSTYLAAAVIIGLLAIGIFLFSPPQNSYEDSDKLKAVSEVKNLSEQEIVNFLKTTSPTENVAVNQNRSKTQTKDNDFTSSLQQMSDKEIQRFLKEYGELDEL